MVLVQPPALDVLMPPYGRKLGGQMLKGELLHTPLSVYLQVVLTDLSLPARGCCQRQNTELDESLIQSSSGILI